MYEMFVAEPKCAVQYITCSLKYCLHLRHIHRVLLKETHRKVEAVFPISKAICPNSVIGQKSTESSDLAYAHVRSASARTRFSDVVCVCYINVQQQMCWPRENESESLSATIHHDSQTHVQTKCHDARGLWHAVSQIWLKSMAPNSMPPSLQQRWTDQHTLQTVAQIIKGDALVSRMTNCIMSDQDFQTPCARETPAH